jgi:uncharacterized protein YcbK (DUF882 family)
LQWTATAALAGVTMPVSRLAHATLAVPIESSITGPAAGSVLSFLNVHTTQRLTVPVITGGAITAEALDGVRQLLHDHHDGSLHDIDPRLLALLSAIMTLTGGSGIIHVLSGYRSPHTNSLLRQSMEGVAPNSYHMRGQAIDFCVPGVPLDTLHQAALSIRGGGVGYYPAHQFLHVDVGPVRHWNGAGGGSAWLPHPGGGFESVVINGHPVHLTPIQARKLAMRRRALAYFRRQRALSGQ